MTNPARVSVITGGSSGIGKQLAGDLLRRGDTVVIVAHDQAKLSAAEQELRAISPRVRAILCDVSSSEDVQRSIAQVLDEFGRVDVLVNNAGFAVYRAFEESSLDEVLKIVDVNLLGALRFMKACLPSMKARRAGQIVNIASIGGRMVITPNSSYCASKYGLVAISEALSYELEHFGISVSVVCPGRVETPFFDHETFRRRAPRKETRLVTTVEDVSAAIVDAIERRRFMTYAPRYLGVVAWAYNALPWIVRPLYRMLMRSRIRSLYAATNTVPRREASE